MLHILKVIAEVIGIGLVGAGVFFLIFLAIMMFGVDWSK